MKNNPSAYTNLDPGIAKYVNNAWKVKKDLPAVNLLHILSLFYFVLHRLD
jgi:hypothetical protein